jgi:hypothetical protein
VGWTPRTIPSQVTVPVWPPDVNSPEDGTNDSPGDSDTTRENVQWVGDSSADAGWAATVAASNSTASTAFVTDATLLVGTVRLMR